MKKMYESPAIVVRELESDNFMDNVISDGGGWHQDLDPEEDPDGDEPIRTPYNPWSVY